MIPARAETERIGPCLDALRGDPDLDELLVVVDDDCDDGTDEVAAAGGARVLRAPPLPSGWVGKPWALQQGLEAARGRWLVQLDADTRPRRGLLRALVAGLERDEADLVTAGTRFVCRTAGERVLHPAMLATLVYRFGPPGAGTAARPARAIANGQCIAVQRERLLRAGGYARAPQHMTDDIALVRSLAGDGWRVAFEDGTRLIDVEMHTSAREVWHEWGRSLSMSDVTSRSAMALDLAVLWTTLAAPLPRLMLRRGTPLDAVLLAVRLALLAGLAPAYAQRGLAFWLSPLADSLAAARLTLSTVRPVRTWRGRTYPR